MKLKSNLLVAALNQKYKGNNNEKNDDLIKIDDYCCVEYDMLKGILLINEQNINKVLLKGKELDIVEFLNHILENEY